MSLTAALPFLSPPVPALPRSSSWSRWRAHFERNRHRPLPPTAEAVDLPPTVASVLARSLARFQIGETGEGRIVGAVARSRMVGVDDDYRRALALFIAEEGRHAHILAGLVRALGGELLTATWTERIFVAVRRLAGIRCKLLVMFAAEVVGAGFYRALAERLPPGATRSALDQIAGDEQDHLRFHRHFFAIEARGGWRRLLFLAAWFPLAHTASLAGLVGPPPNPPRAGDPAAGDRRSPPRARSGGGAMTPFPRHVAVIMDGNGRWATERGLPRSEGHRRGAEAVRRVVRAAHELGVRALTLYAFSVQNWERPRSEVGHLMRLLSTFVTEETPELLARGIRVVTIGDLRRLPAFARAPLAALVVASARNQAMTLCLALSYGGREALAAAARALAAEVASGRLRPEEVDERQVAARLDTSALPPLDLLIRTSGEQRLSNFLLWEAAYAELHFTPVLWPDFGRETLEVALADFERRQRRFGLTGAQVEARLARG